MAMRPFKAHFLGRDLAQVQVYALVLGMTQQLQLSLPQLFLRLSGRNCVTFFLMLRRW